MLVDNSTKYNGQLLGELVKLFMGLTGTQPWITSSPQCHQPKIYYEPHKLTLAETLLGNRREIPAELHNYCTRRTGIAMFWYDNKLNLLSFKSKEQKVVFLLSTGDEEVTFNESTKKPTMVKFYNQTKGGVDTFDQMCSIASWRKTLRWPLCIFMEF